MNFIKHKSNNFTFTAPESMKDRCDDLPVTIVKLNEDTAIKSFWRPNEKDISNILAGGQICLYVIGSSMPPVSVTVECDLASS